METEKKTIPAPPPKTISLADMAIADLQEVAKLRKENDELRARVAELESVIGIQ